MLLIARARRVAATTPPRVWGALAIVYLVWGSTYLAIRVMVEDVPPLLGAGLRFALAGALLAAWICLRGGGLRAMRVHPRELVAAAVTGLLLLGGGNGLVTVAETDVPSSLAALLVASVPLWVVLLRRAAGRERIARGSLLAVLAGFCGVGLLLLPGGRPGGAPLGASLLVVLAAGSWALGSFATARLPMPRGPLRATSLQMMVSGGALALAGVLDGEPGRLHVAHLPADSIIAFAYLVTAGSIVAFTAYVWLLGNAPISQVATYAYVNPAVAVLLGWAILSEPLSALTLAGAAVIVGSVAITVEQEAAPR